MPGSVQLYTSAVVMFWLLESFSVCGGKIFWAGDYLGTTQLGVAFHINHPNQTGTPFDDINPNSNLPPTKL